MKEIKAPHFIPKSWKKKIFLAGSIEMGKAINWQQKVISELAAYEYIILNPRRDDWDSSWVQDIDNEQFNDQVTWELDALDQADIIAMYFDPTTQSPISLLELGLYIESNKLIVCCPQGFWRKGNVDIVCNRYNIPIANNLDQLIISIKDNAARRYD